MTVQWFHPWNSRLPCAVLRWAVCFSPSSMCLGDRGWDSGPWRSRKEFSGAEVGTQDAEYLKRAWLLGLLVQQRPGYVGSCRLQRSWPTWGLNGLGLLCGSFGRTELAKFFSTFFLPRFANTFLALPFAFFGLFAIWPLAAGAAGAVGTYTSQRCVVCDESWGSKWLKGYNTQVFLKHPDPTCCPNSRIAGSWSFASWRPARGQDLRPS